MDSFTRIRLSVFPKACFFSWALLFFFTTGKSMAQDVPQIIHTPRFFKPSSLARDTVLMNRLMQTGNKTKSLSPDSSLVLFQQAYQISVHYKLNAKTARIMAFMAASNIRKGNFEQSEKLMDAAFRLSATVKDADLSCYLHVIAAAMCQHSSDYARASYHYFKAMQVLKDDNLTHSPQLPGLYNNFGSLLISLNEKKYARKYLLEARQYALSGQPIDSSTLSYILVNIGASYIDADTNLAIKYYKEAYAIARLRNDLYLSHTALIDLSDAYISKKDYDSATYYVTESARFALTGPATELTEAQTGQILLDKKNYPLALIHLLKALELAEQNKSQYLAEIYTDLSRCYAEQGQYNKAYDYQQKFLNLNDKEQRSDKNKVIDLLMNYQASEKNKEIAEKQLQLSIKEQALKEKNIWIGVVSGSTLLLLLLLGIAYRSHKNKQRLQEERLQSFTRQQEIEKLKAAAEGEEKERARIAHDLHDGVMVRFAHVKMKLNVLPSLHPQVIATDNYKDLIRHFDLATSELRRTAHNLMPDVLLEDGIAQATFYFCKGLEETSGLSINFLQVGQPIPRLPSEFEIAVYRIVQELLQNIIKHAHATKALVQLNYSDSLFSVTVEDNGAGFDADNHKEGYGIKSIRSRMRILRGSFTIESINRQGTTAYMEFDLSPLLAMQN